MGHAHQFAHRRVPLKVQAAQNTLLGTGMIVLDKIVRQSESFKLISPECFDEESSLVFKDFRAQDNYFSQVS